MGCGNIAQKFTSDLQYVQKATIYAVASKNEEKGKLFSEKFPLNKSLKVLKIMDKIRKKLAWFIQMINKKLMLKATLFRKNHCYSVFIASRNNLTIFYRATRLYNSLYTGF